MENRNGGNKNVVSADILFIPWSKFIIYGIEIGAGDRVIVTEVGKPVFIYRAYT